jgi:hypothetical protein
MIKNMWSTPMLFDSSPKELVEDMASSILSEYDTHTAREFGSFNILDVDNEIIRKFKQEVVYPTFDTYLKETVGKGISEWAGHRMKGWVTSYPHGMSLAYHNHRGSQVSAVFYLLCEERSLGGEIVFTDPRQNANRGYDESFLPWFEHLRITPKTGDIVVFPSFLYHYVATYQSNIRLAMPVDLFLHSQGS